MERKRLLTSDDMLDMAGTYYNPVTEIVVTVDDTNYVDLSEVNLDKYSGKKWIRISEDPLNDSTRLEETLQVEIELEGGPKSTKDISDTSEEQQD
ncbi:MAG: hypothetical protein E3J54_01605 [Actinobacteria bacterium]|nr:MAG: hypothetical protein E3J54_01605 [Actinomycetota bacterium]